MSGYFLPVRHARKSGPDGVFFDTNIAMQDYEIFLLINDDEISLGTVEEILNLEATTSLATIFADIISNMIFSYYNSVDPAMQTFKIELRNPDGL